MRHILIGFLLLCGAFAVPAVSVAASFAELSPQWPPGTGPGPDPLQDLILVQSTDYTPPETSDSKNEPYEPPPPGVPVDAVGITPEMTKAIVASVADVNQYCRDHYLSGYVIDCLAKGYMRVGRALPYKGGYSAARVALMSAGARLHELALSHADPKMPVKRGPTGKRAPAVKLTAVANPDAVMPAASVIVDGAQLVLLRSASGSQQRRAAYESIAAVVGTSKVLLRSARRKRPRYRAA